MAELSINEPDRGKATAGLFQGYAGCRPYMAAFYCRDDSNDAAGYGHQLTPSAMPLRQTYR